MVEFSSPDICWMKTAIELGKKGIGYTEPNPMVGAVVVKNGKVLSSGFHRHFGAEHAEAMALNRVEETHATLYVPLEPCCHLGKTPPCTDLIIKKKIRRVVIALQDPNPLVNGQGIRRLEQNRIRVDRGCLASLYSRLNRHYLGYMTRKRPYVTLKAGVSLDGKLTDKFRKSRWITGDKFRQISRSFRGEFSAILTGDLTVGDDNPALTINENEWPDKKLWRVVLDTHNRLDSKKQIFREQSRFPLILFSSERAKDRATKTDHHHFVPAFGDELDLKTVLDILFLNGIASVLVEGGGRIINSFLKNRLADEIILFTAHKLIGGTGSVQLFASGAGLSEPITLVDPEILDFESGMIVRGSVLDTGGGE
jgi:diaminohydroxyphosphoribosylaminopyrimidine deaminase/5-amino-6-(5-phosphoribosylamino)uracil reductase